MDFKSKIKSLIKEAEFYRNQGLLAESRESYEQVTSLVKKNLPPADGKKLLNNIAEKINGLDKEIRFVEKKVLSPNMTEESQDLITKMFEATEGEDENGAAMEGAKALIKFGQFDRAKKDLEKLLQVESKRVEAARHIINCLFLESRVDDAISQYKDWVAGDLFSEKQIVTLKRFIEKTFKSRGIERTLPGIKDQDKVIELDIAKAKKDQKTTPSQKPVAKPATPKPAGKPKVVEPAAAEDESEDFEEFDILASIKKTKIPDKKK
jgi:tetratricopeptide (TPR) repeat protein